MRCNEAQALLPAYVDGELELSASLEFERHLQDCPACQRQCRDERALSSSLRTAGLRFEPPLNLQRRVELSLRQAQKSERGNQRRIWWLGLASSAVAAMILLVVGLRSLPPAPSRDSLVDELVAGHVRSLMVDHLTDVVSSDRHTVKPWFDGKLDYSPEVEDLAGQGFPLVGGRLDYLGDRAVAALVYRHRQHLINVFVWPAGGAAESRTRELDRQGYHLVGWTRSGMTHWAVSDLARDELRQFVKLLVSDADRAQAQP